MLRFFIATLENPADWPNCIPQIQSVINNSTSSAGKSPNEICYGFTPNFTIDFTKDEAVQRDLPKARISTSDALDFAVMNTKHNYDRKHTAMFLKVGEYALLRLHRGYSIPSAPSKKLHQQYVGPFKVLEKVGRLAYRLDIPPHWKIHNVFSIAMLEPSPAPDADPYECPFPEQPDAVHADTEEFEVERLLDKHVITKGRGQSIQYLVRWTGYGPEHDQWYRIQDLQGCTELLKEYEERIAQRDAPESAKETTPDQTIQGPPTSGTRRQRRNRR